MGARLVTIALSHPGEAARLALEQAGIDHDVLVVPGGLHPVVVRALGFRGVTVPAVRFADGRRVQGSRAITAAVDARHPDAGLFAPDRAAVAEAERWGEEVLQPIPRRLIRRGLRDSLAQRQWFADVASPFPAPKVVGALLTPVVPAFVHQAGATRERVAQDLAELPALLDRVDALLADGLLGGERLNAADLQIGTTVRILLASGDTKPLVAGRPCEALARRVWPDLAEIPAAVTR